MKSTSAAFGAGMAGVCLLRGVRGNRTSCGLVLCASLQSPDCAANTRIRYDAGFTESGDQRTARFGVEGGGLSHRQKLVIQGRLTRAIEFARSGDGGCRASLSTTRHHHLSALASAHSKRACIPVASRANERLFDSANDPYADRWRELYGEYGRKTAVQTGRSPS
jgi:hypothetical protein